MFTRLLFVPTFTMYEPDTGTFTRIELLFSEPVEITCPFMSITANVIVPFFVKLLVVIEISCGAFAWTLNVDFLTASSCGIDIGGSSNCKLL